MKKLFLLFSFSLVFCTALSAQTIVRIGVHPFSSKLALSWDAGDFHRSLADWSANQSFSQHFRLTPFDAATEQRFQVFIKGHFDLIANREFLIMEVYDSTGKQAASLKSELYSKDKDVVLDLAYLKIKTFLQTSLFGTLEIKTRPVEAKVWINGLLSGSTPLELVLSRDRYNLKIGKSEFAEQKDSLAILPGARISKEYVLKYQGLNHKPFLYSGLALTVFTIASKFYENKLHQEYRNLGPYLPDKAYTDKFHSYRNMNYLTVTLIDVSTICYGITAYCLIKNRVMEKKYLNE